MRAGGHPIASRTTSFDYCRHTQHHISLQQTPFSVLCGALERKKHLPCQTRTPLWAACDAAHSTHPNDRSLWMASLLEMTESSTTKMVTWTRSTSAAQGGTAGQKDPNGKTVKQKKHGADERNALLEGGKAQPDTVHETHASLWRQHTTMTAAPQNPTYLPSYELPQTLSPHLTSNVQQ